jgi:general L-amino acid transport system permease protein
MQGAVSYKPDLKPPVTRVGIIGWIRGNLFNGVFNSLLTLLVLYGLWKIVPPLFEWAFVDSLWFSSAEQCKMNDGACWSVVSRNIRFIMFGFYPYELHWRPISAVMILLVLLGLTWNRNHWKKPLGVAWVVGAVAMGVLMRGGIFGLEVVESTEWGGLPLTFFLAGVAMVVAYPVGVLLALGRQSRMPLIKTICVVYIEMIRGVPLITLLFMSVMMFPLFMPEGVTINKILRAQGALIMFTSAYIAEVVRGGLQGMNKGQYEAAQSLGLGYYHTMRLVILPQALKIVIPPTVSILIVAFKDTSLLVIIALYDLLKTTESVLSQPKWMGFSSEAYLFLALIYFFCCFAMSQYSRKLERELGSGR